MIKISETWRVRLINSSILAVYILLTGCSEGKQTVVSFGDKEFTIDHDVVESSIKDVEKKADSFWGLEEGQGESLFDFLTTKPAIADKVISVRDKSYDSLLPDSYYLTQEQAKPFILNQYKFPQQLDSVTSHLGVPHAEDGDFSYWRISNTSEIAVRVINDLEKGLVAEEFYICDLQSCI